MDVLMVLLGSTVGFLIYCMSGFYGGSTRQHSLQEELRHMARVQPQHYDTVRPRTCGYCGRTKCGCGAEDYRPIPDK